VPAERVGRLILVKTAAASASSFAVVVYARVSRMISARIWTARSRG
jgi:predicted site-specific integrase-resolvase